VGEDFYPSGGRLFEYIYSGKVVYVFLIHSFPPLPVVGSGARDFTGHPWVGGQPTSPPSAKREEENAEGG